MRNEREALAGAAGHALAVVGITLFSAVNAVADGGSNTDVGLLSLNKSCALVAGDKIRCWTSGGNAKVPVGSFVSVVGGGGGACGLRIDHTVVCWDWYEGHEGPNPPGLYSQIAMGGHDKYPMACGTHLDGKSDCWSRPNLIGPVPPGVVTLPRPPKPLPGPTSQYALGLEAEMTGGYVDVLRPDGRVEDFAFSNLRPAGGLAGTFSKTGGFCKLRANGPIACGWLSERFSLAGQYVDLTRRSGGLPECPNRTSSFCADVCGLRSDGQADCAAIGGKPTRLRGPFVQIVDGCAIRLDGHVEKLDGRCTAPSDLVVAIPDALRARITPRPSLMEVLNSIETARATKGTQRSYRIAFSLPEKDGSWLGAAKQGVGLTGPNLVQDGQGHRGLGTGAEATFTLVDLNGGDLEYGDRAYLKLGSRFVIAQSVGGIERVSLGTAPSKGATWSIHSRDECEALRGGAQPRKAIDLAQRTTPGVLLRAETGKFLLPESADAASVPGETAADGPGEKTLSWALDPFGESPGALDCSSNSTWDLWPLIKSTTIKRE